MACSWLVLLLWKIHGRLTSLTTMVMQEQKPTRTQRVGHLNVSMRSSDRRYFSPRESSERGGKNSPQPPVKQHNNQKQQAIDEKNLR